MGPTGIFGRRAHFAIQNTAKSATYGKKSWPVILIYEMISVE
jgi:hypothetical protein